MKKNISLCTVFVISIAFLTSCSSNKNKNVNSDVQAQMISAKQSFLTRYQSMVGRTPNEVYSIIGKPADYKTMMNKKNQIEKAKITYEYIYNYDKRSYDCVINYYTDKDQKVIKDFEYNSDKCYYISYF